LPKGLPAFSHTAKNQDDDYRAHSASGLLSPDHPCWDAAVGGLIEAFDEVLDLRVPHGLGRLVDVHHHGQLKVRYGADPVIVRDRAEGGA